MRSRRSMPCSAPAPHAGGAVGDQPVELGQRLHLDDPPDGGAPGHGTAHGPAQIPSDFPMISFMISVVPP